MAKDPRHYDRAALVSLLEDLLALSHQYAVKKDLDVVTRQRLAVHYFMEATRISLRLRMVQKEIEDHDLD